MGLAHPRTSKVAFFPSIRLSHDISHSSPCMDYKQQYEAGIVDTTDGKPPCTFDAALGAPCSIDPATGQHQSYWVLSDAERAKGFIRPVRASYVHVGPPGPRFPLRDLTEEERTHFGSMYVKYEPYPSKSASTAVGLDPDQTTNPGRAVGQYWTQAQLDAAGRGCRTRTTMGSALAETYARDPRFYGATFCCGCRTHLPVAEFVWDGTMERVGS